MSRTLTSTYSETSPSSSYSSVGMPLKDVYAKLGKEDIKSPAENGETLYWYNHDTKSKENRGNLYLFEKNGRIARIVIAYQ